MKKEILFIALMLILPVVLTGCNKQENDKENQATVEENASLIENVKTANIKIYPDEVHQTIEGFGASGAWWSQKVGGWTKEHESGLETREYIAKLLFDKEEGIALNIYRYNVGAGSADSGNGDISDSWRRAEAFEVEPGVYDFTKDANAVWFMNKAVELGASDVVMFANSPLERLTVTGNAHGNADSESKSNLAPENYKEYANYFLDVAEHFIDEGVPVKFISPINEPQWEWTSGQEGCHYTPQEVVAFLKVFIEEKEKRKKLAEVEITAPESGEWGNTNYDYMEAILSDELLSTYFTSIDNHSYWSDAGAKREFRTWIEKKGFENMVLRTSEWCEMINGRDYTMDSALTLAKEVNDDLTILDVVSWQYWIAVSCYDYHDGLIYVSKDTQKVIETKRLWAMGNFSKFIHTGYQRIGTDTVSVGINASAFMGNNGSNDELVIVVINSGVSASKYDVSELAGDKDVKIYVTDKDYDLEEVSKERYVEGTVYLGAKSVTTIIIPR